MFPLPYQTVETIRDSSNAIDTTITVRRVYTRTLSSGLNTITAGADESFQTPYSGVDFLVANASTGTVYDMSLSDGTAGAARLNLRYKQC